jgi:4-alpha-glucanotransferase
MSAAPWCERSAGVLLHTTSLPGGPWPDQMRRFARRLSRAGCRVWQLLPLGPSAAERNPFAASSAFAAHADLTAGLPVVDRRTQVRYREENADWLEDWALFAALKSASDGAPWWDWPMGLRRREADALASARHALADAIERERDAQCRFDAAWSAFHAAIKALGLQLFGDLPLFVARDSADVWAQRELFEADIDGRLTAVAGVPPDYFSETGQLWGLPPYRWDVMAATGYAWWRRRFEIQARRHDLLRIDHFRGLAGWWRIPPDAPTAATGAWVPGPGRAAIDAVLPALGATRLVAEDLGVITEDVVALRRSLGLPGMRVLQFAFDGNPENPHLPRHHEPDTVCYTGTHDNDTTLGWWRGLSAGEQAEVARILDGGPLDMPGALIDLAWSSPAPLAIVPMQDLLGLGNDARMNRPGIADGNWRWSFGWEQVSDDFESTLRAALLRHGRIS